jgi:hypothetical protein
MAVPEADAPFIVPYGLAGNSAGFRSKGNTALAVKRALAHLGFLLWEPAVWDLHWNAKLSDAAAAWKRKRGLIPADSNDGSWGQKSHDVMRSAWFTEDQKPAFDGESQRLLKEEKRAYDADQEPPDTKVPDLGPLWQGGLSVLQQDCTHMTSGMSVPYPAFDDAFVQGRIIIAPEKVNVYKASSSNPGDAFYGAGASKIEYWFGHLLLAPAVGTVLQKGAKVGEVAPNSIGGGPHVHLGLDTRPLTGKTLLHHTDYTHGAPLIGDQLAKELD